MFCDPTGCLQAAVVTGRGPPRAEQHRVWHPPAAAGPRFPRRQQELTAREPFPQSWDAFHHRRARSSAGVSWHRVTERMGQLLGQGMAMAIPQQPSPLRGSAAEGRFELLSSLPLLLFSSLLPSNSLPVCSSFSPSVHPSLFSSHPSFFSMKKKKKVREGGGRTEERQSNSIGFSNNLP